ncbi:MAG: guanylate kinase, partial [Chloroflexi bacterium]|nr:guanylate kinase [Chloroflexota bacterium]
MPGQRREGAAGAQVIVISGPSGVGKDTIINELRRRPIGQTFHYVVTCTTREPRAGEMNGVHYHFHTDETFAALNAASGLLESASVHGRSYGTPRSEVRDALERGQDAILKIDVQGARSVRAAIPEAILIFIAPPSAEALAVRLAGRGTETAEELVTRAKSAIVEMDRAKEYDYLV